MGSASRRWLLWLLAAALAVAALSSLTLPGGAGGDFAQEAWPSVHALLLGHLAGFFRLAPSYGGSLILRAPLFLLTGAFGGGRVSTYVLSTLGILVVAAAFALWLVEVMRRRGVGPATRATVVGLSVVNPMAIEAVQHGHPEEILGAVLCLVAVLAALQGRPTLAGVALGLAIGNKAWGILAVGPVLVALPRGRWRALGWTVGIAGALLIPFLLAGATGGGPAGRSTITSTGVFFNRWQVWWFIGSPGHLYPHVDPRLVIPYRAGPHWLEVTAHPLIAVLALPLTLLYIPASRRKTNKLETRYAPLLLLAFLLLLRFVLDPADFSYYSLPWLLALLTWEALRFNRPPVLTLGASLLAWFVFLETDQPALGLSTDAQALIFLVFALIAMGLIGGRLYLAGRPHWARGRVGDPRSAVSSASLGPAEVS
jgi:hypothetical protein